MNSKRLNEIKAVSYKYCQEGHRIDVGFDPGDEGCEFIKEARRAIPECLAEIDRLNKLIAPLECTCTRIDVTPGDHGMGVEIHKRGCPHA